MEVSLIKPISIFQTRPTTICEKWRFTVHIIKNHQTKHQIWHKYAVQKRSSHFSCNDPLQVS